MSQEINKNSDNWHEHLLEAPGDKSICLLADHFCDRQNFSLGEKEQLKASCTRAEAFYFQCSLSDLLLRIGLRSSQ